jgi:hypothetical protein
MAYAFVKHNSVVRHGPLTVRVTRGDVWDADDSFVKANPGLFDEVGTIVHRTDPVVEQATAAPGEKRSTTRRQKK